MQQLLEQINTLPGVVGCLIRSDKGDVVGHAFTPLFDLATIQEAAGCLDSVCTGINGSHGPDFLDLRFSEGRILVRPLSGAQLLLLCTKEVNLQVLTISLNVATKKLEKILSEKGPQISASEAVVIGAEILGPVSAESEGLYLEAGNLVPSEANKGFEQLGMVAVNQSTAHRISNYFGTGAVKKATLVNPANNKSGVFPLMVVNDDDGKYDGKLILGKSIEKKLDATAGDRLLVKI